MPGTAATARPACSPTLSWSSYRLAAVLRAEDGLKKDLDGGLIPLTVPEVRRLGLAMVGPGERRRFRLGWST
jgi:hypothetical protein